MNGVVSVIMSKFDDIFEVFVKSYLDTCNAKLIVVDDGLSDSIKAKYGSQGVVFEESLKPFGFTKNLNHGFRLAGDSDVLYFNDDCYIHTAKFVEKLMDVAYADKDIGMVSPMMINQMNEDQFPLNQKRHKDCLWTPLGYPYALTTGSFSFTLVYFKREMLDKVGMLDEGFSGWGAEAREYCARAAFEGYKQGVVYSAFVEHGGNKFGRLISNSRARTGQLKDTNEPYFNKKMKELTAKYAKV